MKSFVSQFQRPTIFGELAQKWLLRVSQCILCATSLYLVGLCFHHHELRSSLMPVELCSPIELQHSTTQSQLHFDYEKLELLTDFTSRLPKGIPSESNQLLQCSEIMNFLANEYRQYTRASSAWVPEAPDVALEYLYSRRIHGSCYNDAILFSTMAQSLGYQARLIDWAGADGLGGSGHSLVEVWLSSLHKWVLFDPQQNSFCTFRVSNLPLSALELRRSLLNSSAFVFDRMVQIRQKPGFKISKGAMYSFYKKNCVEHLVLARNDFFTAKKTEVGRILSSSIANTEKYFGSGSVKLGRIVRALVSRPAFKRFRLVDASSPTLSYHGWYLTFRVVSSFWLLAILCMIVLLISRRAGRHRRHRHRLNRHHMCDVAVVPTSLSATIDSPRTQKE